jgi:hypothetical protein
MVCIDPKIGEYTFMYDALEGEMLIKLNGHLQTCRHCALELYEFLTILGIAREELSNHIHADELLEYGRTSSQLTLSAEGVNTVKTHLLICEECRQVLESFKAANKLLNAFSIGKEIPLPPYWTEERQNRIVERLKQRVNKFGLGPKQL